MVIVQALQIIKYQYFNPNNVIIQTQLSTLLLIKDNLLQAANFRYWWNIFMALLFPSHLQQQNKYPYQQKSQQYKCDKSVKIWQERRMCKIQEIDFKDSYNFGTLSDDGEYLVTWSEHCKEIRRIN
ncbi:unnamed protein product (macronuclear) [Paramecium tetraurelia]|uniref:Uncharacterized protein n=1 Tax=Paramecium tetraurelia TaxID=5888 RepID=A0CB98_PARTE|nr:uncharacterized protein GSPATT00036848001 [Paramecium tetraurelia]CAK68065.1 unnamed protein product [Paramecium tetraurelia]|eukprot:XP_001435462.1 hypothetical protein (macronuclear) [Paramecium tetraurelia strain d4-2]